MRGFTAGTSKAPSPTIPYFDFFDTLGRDLGPTLRNGYRFAATVPSFFQMCFSGTVPRTQEVG